MLTPEEIIAPELFPEEQVRWKGMTSLNTALRSNLWRVIVGLVFTVLPYASSDHSHLASRYPFYAIWTGISLSFVYQALVPILTVGTTAFAVTDRRALWVRRSSGTKVRSFPAGEINVLEYDVKPDGSGSIAFRSVETNGADGRGIEKIGFYGVQNVAGAYQALLQLRFHPQ